MEPYDNVAFIFGAPSQPRHHPSAASPPTALLPTAKGLSMRALTADPTLTAAIAAVLDDSLHLGGRARTFTAATPLLGALPELDSLAVVQLIAALQERFAIEFEDEDLSGETFASVGALADLVAAKGGRP